MTIKTWTSFSKRRNSTKQPTGSGNVKTITLKHPTSIINPVFLLTDYNRADNYCQWGNRYYFIDDIIFVNAGQAEYHCSVDPMASWKTEIGSMSEYVVRSASSYDGKISDGIYPVKAGDSYATDEIDLASGIVPQSGITASWDNVNGTYVVGVVGKTPTSGSIGYYALTASNFSQLLDKMYDIITMDFASITDFTQEYMKTITNPFQYIVSCNWFPFSLSGLSTLPVKFGWWDSGVSAGVITRAVRSISLSKGLDTVTNHPEAATRGAYLNGQGYSRRTLYCWTFGQIPVDSTEFVNNPKINLSMEIDLFTGGARLDVNCTDSNNASARISRNYAPMCAPVQIAQRNQNIYGAANAVNSMNASAFSLNPFSTFFFGIESGINNYMQAMTPQVQVMGSNGSNIDFIGKPRLVSQFYYQTPMDATQNGRPLCQQVTINSLSGYIKTENADVDLPCTQEERDKIAAYMNGGFFYE